MRYFTLYKYEIEFEPKSEFEFGYTQERLYHSTSK